MTASRNKTGRTCAVTIPNFECVSSEILISLKQSQSNTMFVRWGSLYSMAADFQVDLWHIPRNESCRAIICALLWQDSYNTVALPRKEGSSLSTKNGADTYLGYPGKPVLLKSRDLVAYIGYSIADISNIQWRWPIIAPVSYRVHKIHTHTSFADLIRVTDQSTTDEWWCPRLQRNVSHILLN